MKDGKRRVSIYDDVVFLSGLRRSRNYFFVMNSASRKVDVHFSVCAFCFSLVEDFGISKKEGY